MNISKEKHLASVPLSQIKNSIANIQIAINTLEEIENGVGKETYEYEIQLLNEAKNSLEMDID